MVVPTASPVSGMAALTVVPMPEDSASVVLVELTAGPTAALMVGPTAALMVERMVGPMVGPTAAPTAGPIGAQTVAPIAVPAAEGDQNRSV